MHEEMYDRVKGENLELFKRKKKKMYQNNRR